MSFPPQETSSKLIRESETYLHFISYYCQYSQLILESKLAELESLNSSRKPRLFISVSGVRRVGEIFRSSVEVRICIIELLAPL